MLARIGGHLWRLGGEFRGTTRSVPIEPASRKFAGHEEAERAEREYDTSRPLEQRVQILFGIELKDL